MGLKKHKFLCGSSKKDKNLDSEQKMTTQDFTTMAEFAPELALGMPLSGVWIDPNQSHQILQEHYERSQELKK